MDSPALFFGGRVSDASSGAHLPSRFHLSSNTTQSNGSIISKGSPSSDGFSFGGKQVGGSSAQPSVAQGHKHSQQQHGTPSLFFLGGSKHHSSRRSSASPSKLPSCSPSSKQSAKQDTASAHQDIINERDSSSSGEPEKPDGVLLDLELQTCSSGSEVDKLIANIPEQQLKGVQRLLCNPSVLYASLKTLASLSQCKSLGFLILSLLPDHDTSSPAWDEKLLAGLLQSLPYLVCLDLSDCSISDRNLILIAQASCSPQIRAMDLSYSPEVSMLGVTVLLDSCPLLEELDLSACENLQISDVAVKLIGQRCPLLSSLFIEASESGQAVGQVTMRSLTELVFRCKHLAVLFLTGLDLAFDHQEWEAFVSNGSNVQSLGLSFEGSQFGNSDMHSMSIGLSELNLISLSLRGCSSLTNDGVISALPILPQLSELSFLNCPSIDSDGLNERINYIKGEGFCFAVRSNGTSKQEEVSEPTGSPAAPAWSSLLSFLVTSASDMNINSVKKIRR